MEATNGTEPRKEHPFSTLRAIGSQRKGGGARASGVSWALGMALAAGCVHPELHGVGRNAPGQHVVRASQYAFTTDFELDAEDGMVRELVDLRDDVTSELRLPPGTSIVRVIVFESQQRYDEFLRRNYPDLPTRRAFFIKQSGDQLTVFACRGDRLREDLRHEATHALLHSVLPKVPLWLDEGLAEYFAAGVKANGFVPKHVERLAQEPDLQGNRWDLARLERMTDLWQMGPDDYRESWLWVHFCLHQSPETKEVLLHYLADLRAGKDGSLRDRLQAVLPHPEPLLSRHLANLADSIATSPSADPTASP
ncbi:MAG: hypothetical protein U1D30_08455 [Planctomycetota bacterium]